jgi:hypothetical protein
MLVEPFVRELAAQLRQTIDAALGAEGTTGVTPQAVSRGGPSPRGGQR